MRHCITFDNHQDLPAASVTESDEVLAFIEHQALHDKGIGYVDAHLLASAALAGRAQLWTRDQRLLIAAKALGCAFEDSTAH